MTNLIKGNIKELSWIQHFRLQYPLCIFFLFLRINLSTDQLKHPEAQDYTHSFSLVMSYTFTDVFTKKSYKADGFV